MSTWPKMEDLSVMSGDENLLQTLEFRLFVSRMLRCSAHYPHLLPGARIPYRLAFLVAQHKRIGASYQLSGKDHIRRFLFDF